MGKSPDIQRGVNTSVASTADERRVQQQLERFEKRKEKEIKVHVDKYADKKGQ